MVFEHVSSRIFPTPTDSSKIVLPFPPMTQIRVPQEARLSPPNKTTKLLFWTRKCFERHSWTFYSRCFNKYVDKSLTPRSFMIERYQKFSRAREKTVWSTECRFLGRKQFGSVLRFLRGRVGWETTQKTNLNALNRPESGIWTQVLDTLLIGGALTTGGGGL